MAHASVIFARLRSLPGFTTLQNLPSPPPYIDQKRNQAVHVAGWCQQTLGDVMMGKVTTHRDIRGVSRQQAAKILAALLPLYTFTRLGQVSLHAFELGGPQQCLSIEPPSHDRREPFRRAFQLFWYLPLWVKSRALLGGVV